MIAKSFTYSSAPKVKRLAVHLMRVDENEVATVADVRGMTKQPELSDMMESMWRTTYATNGLRGVFHLTINPDNEQAHAMTAAEWDKTLAAYEKEFQLEQQPRIIVLHHKIQPDGLSTRPHLHVLYQTADVERGRQCDDFGNHGLRCGKVSRQLERELGHELLPDRKGKEKTYDQKRHQQAKRQGVTVEEQRQQIREAWISSRSGAEFQATLQAKGFDLANGKRLCVVTPQGDFMALGKELAGTASAKEIKQRLQGQTLEPLEAVTQRHRERQRENDRAATPADHWITHGKDQRHEARKAAQTAKQPPDKNRSQRTPQELREAFAQNRRDEVTTNPQRGAQRAEQFAENRAETVKPDTQEKPLTATDELRQAFEANKRDSTKLEKSTDQRAEEFIQNKLTPFEERFGRKLEPDELEREL